MLYKENIMSRMKELYFDIEEDLLAGATIEAVARKYGAPVQWVVEVAEDLGLLAES